MSEIQENTEAKLAAYIDGELEGAERAEIEKLIELNPNYRRVLEQLRVTRDLLRGLPREPAPPELAEAFNGQLERSVLLEGADSRGRSSHIQRWPQWAAIAAIVLLTVGLGAVVYFVLPKSRPPMQLAADKSAPALESTLPASSDPSEENIDRNQPGQNPIAQMPGTSTENRQAGSAGRRLEGVGGGGFGAGGGAATVPLAEGPQALADNVFASPSVQELLSGSASNQLAGAISATGPAPAARPALVIVVRSSDPPQIDREVTNYFNTNNIAWEAVSARAQLALNSVVANNSNYQAAPAQNQFAERELRQQAGRQSRGGISQAAAPQLSVQQQINQTQEPANATPIDNIYVARRLSGRQAQELSNALGQQGLNADAALRESTAATSNSPLQVAAQPQQTPPPTVARQRYAYWQSRDGQAGQSARQEASKDAIAKSAASESPSTEPGVTLKSNESINELRRTTQPSERARSVDLTTAAALRDEYAATAPAFRNALSNHEFSPTTAQADKLAVAGDEPVDVIVVVQKLAAASDPSSTTKPADQPEK